MYCVNIYCVAIVYGSPAINVAQPVACGVSDNVYVYQYCMQYQYNDQWRQPISAYVACGSESSIVMRIESGLTGVWQCGNGRRIWQ